MILIAQEGPATSDGRNEAAGPSWAIKILHYWRRYQKVQAKIERAHRNRAILQRAAKGWTNAELGARFKLSKAQISRIIRKAIEAEAKRDL